MGGLTLSRALLALTLVALTVLPLVPVGTADTVYGSSYGVNGGFVVAGLWDLWWFQFNGGTATLSLTWQTLPVPIVKADYDLHLYKQGALDDGVLRETELIAVSEHHEFSECCVESITLTLPAGKYVVAVVPFMTEGETYTLAANGRLQYATYTPTPGVQIFP